MTEPFDLSNTFDIPPEGHDEIKKAGFKIEKLEINTNHLKKYLFLFIKGNMCNGDTLGQIDDKLTIIVKGVFKMFYTKKNFGHSAGLYPFAYDENGEQIGRDKEDYK